MHQADQREGNAPGTTQPRTRIYPDLIHKEAAAALAALAVVGLVAAVWDAPLEAPADPEGIAGHDVKAPWIFVGIQLILRHLPPVVAGVVIPLAGLVLIAGLPYCGLGRSVSRIVFLGTILAALGLTVWGYVS